MASTCTFSTRCVRQAPRVGGSRVARQQVRIICSGREQSPLKTAVHYCEHNVPAGRSSHVGAQGIACKAFELKPPPYELDALEPHMSKVRLVAAVPGSIRALLLCGPQTLHRAAALYLSTARRAPLVAPFCMQ